MKTINKLLGLLACAALLSVLSACGGSLSEKGSSSDTEGETANSEDSGDSPEAVASFGTNDHYLYVSDTAETLDATSYPAMSTLQVMARGLVKIFDPERHFPIDWDDTENLPPLVTLDEVEDYMEENDHPNSYGCALPADPTDSDVLTTNGAGTNSLPPRDASWTGYESGGCGTWSTAMCNRILGITDSESQVTREEWNDIASGIGQNGSGGSKMSKQSEYYESLGYCVEDKKFGGSAEDYSEMVEKINDRCDVKLFLWKRNADGTYTNGHVETVTGADADTGTAETNSWGNTGTVRGGNDGGFDHSLDGTQFQDDAGNELWPEDSTEVWVSYVCECGFFEGIAKKLFGM